MAFEVNISSGDSKSSFIGWMDQWNATLPGVSSDEGGTKFAKAIYGTGGAYGGPKFIIKPDRKFVRTNSPSSDLVALGVKKGGGTAITPHNKSEVSKSVKVNAVTSETLTLELQQKATVSIAISQLDGRQVATLSAEHLSSGIHEISLRELNLAQGVFVLRISTGATELNHLFIK